MNPFSMAQLATMGFSNPDAFSSMMSLTGTAPPQMGISGLMQNDPLQNFFLPTGSAAATPEMGAMTTGAAATAGANPMAALSGLQGVKAPEAAKPVFSGGVSGAQAAPQMKVGQGNSDVTQAIMSMLMNKGNTNPLRVPDLAALMKGI